MEKNVARKLDIDKNILDLFWRLGNKDTTTRINTCSDILNAVIKKQQEVENENELCKDLKYSIERLVKGLASARDAARLGYSLLLTEILKKITNVQIEEVLELMKKHLTITGKQDKRDLVFGQLFAYTAIIRSKRLPNHAFLSHVVLSLYDLYQGKTYIVNATYGIILDLFSQLSNENFKQNIWPQLKTKLPDNWENCSVDSLWVLLLCIRMFPDAVSSKYLKKHWTDEDIFSSENIKYIRKIIKQTSSTLPMLHPLCSEFLLLAKQRKDFGELWNAVVDDNLFDSDQGDHSKSVIGFEMVESALHEPHKKIVKVVLSPKFRAVFSRAFLNAKHPLNPAARHLAEFLCNFVKVTAVPEIQIITLKTFLLPPGKVLIEEVLKKKEVSLIIQHLLPDAVKVLFGVLKAVVLKNKASSGDEKVNNMIKIQAIIQIGNLVAHPAILTDIEWRMDIIRFLFLNSFFTVKGTTSDIPHCEKLYDPLPDPLRDACTNAFYKAVHSLHMRSENNQSPLETFLQQLLALIEYADVLMNATENVDLKFSVEKIQSSWNHLKSIVHKLSKQSKKDGHVNESNAFQVLFLQLGFLLFQDPDHTSEILEELYICCKKALKVRKHEADNEDGDNEPPWIGVVIDILLSLLSKSSKHLRSTVTYVFPLFCPFIDNNALQQILDVINPQGAEDMLVNESDEEGEAGEDIEFGSGSSSDESEGEQNTNQPVDEEFKKKIQQALGPAAGDSDAESVVLSDSEMFKLDDALSQVFKERTKSGHTLLASEEKTLLNFRVRCFDLIMAYLKSEPPMHLVLMCLEPTLAAFEFGHHSKHQSSLLRKAVSVLQFMTKIKKFKHTNDVRKSELKKLLDAFIPKCHKETDIATALKLYSLCIFIVLCYRKLEKTDSPDKKKSSKTPSYIKTYLSNLDTFVSNGSSNMLPQFFSKLMEACPDLSWHFIEPCKNYAFNSNVRLFRKTQCLGLLSEALKYSKGQKDVTDDQWLEFGENIFPLAIESLKNALDNSAIKPVYFTELLNIIFTSHAIIKEKIGKSMLEKYTDLLPLLTETDGKKMLKIAKVTKLRNKIIQSLGRNIQSVKSKAATLNDTEANFKQEKRKSEEAENCENLVNGDDVSTQSKKKKFKRTKKNAKQNFVIDVSGDSSMLDLSDS